MNISQNLSLYVGNCLSIIPTITDSIDLVFADLPYGKTSNKWDIPIDLKQLWEILPNCTCLFTASSGFEYELFNSNPGQYNYKWIWDKNNSAGFALAKKRPLAVTEDVLIFRQSQYFPQMEVRGKVRKKGGYSASSNYGIVPTISHNNEYYPKSLIHFSSASQVGKRHPTQKPLGLLEYLIQTYSSPGQTVLDPVMGSGSTGEACLKLGRKFIGIEKDPGIFQETLDYLLSVWNSLENPAKNPNLDLYK